MSIIEGAFFQRKTDGTGTVLDNTQLGVLPGVGLASFNVPEYRKTQIGGLIRWEIDAIVVPVEPNVNDIALMRDQINAYITNQLNTFGFRPVEIVTLPNGKLYVRTRRQQRGDLIAVDAFSVQRVLDTNVAISEISIIENDAMPHGGMKVRYVFIKESDQALPEQRWVSFRRRNGGTGSFTGTEVNLTPAETQSSRLTQFSRQTDGPLQRLSVRVWYASEFGTRTLASILAHVDSQKSLMQWSQPIIRGVKHGHARILNTRNNFGDVYLTDVHGGVATQTLIQNVQLEDARVVRSDEQGGVEIEYTFINVRPEYTPDARYVRFRIRNNGTGSHRKTVPLTIDDGEAAWLWDFTYTGQGLLTVARVRVWMPNDHGDTELLNVQAKAEGIRNDCEFKPPVIKSLPRGKGIMPNLHDNFGDLVIHTSHIDSSSSVGDVLLDNCTLLEPPRIFDTLNENGVGMEFKFARIADSNEITG